VIYLWHHVATLTLALVAAWALSRARWPHRSPQVAVLLWQVTALSVLASIVGILLSAGLAPYQRGILPALVALTQDIGHPIPLGAGQLVTVAAGLLLAAGTLGVQAHSSWRVHRHRSRHKTLLRLVSPSWPPGEPVVLDHPAAAAYYLPGPSGCIVISSGAQSALTADQLAAVLAHERAHARRRHHLALAPFRALSQALPAGPITRTTARVELLLEMCADDDAVRHRGAAQLIAALQRFAQLGGSAHPPGTLAAAGQATAARIHRLRHAGPPPHIALRTTALLVALTVAATPLSLYVLPG
jgi:Zn-dependent protease with chaperone function